MEISAQSFVKEIQGYEVTRVWRGHGSAIFLELGKLTVNQKGKSKGESTVCIEWSWRIDNDTTVLLGTWDDESEIDKSVDLLLGRVIEKISFFLNIKELDIEFDNGMHLISFSTVGGDPHWYIRNSGDQYLSFKKGSFNNAP